MVDQWVTSGWPVGDLWSTSTTRLMAQWPLRELVPRPSLRALPGAGHRGGSQESPRWTLPACCLRSRRQPRAESSCSLPGSQLRPGPRSLAASVGSFLLVRWSWPVTRASPWAPAATSRFRRKSPRQLPVLTRRCAAGSPPLLGRKDGVGPECSLPRLQELGTPEWCPGRLRLQGSGCSAGTAHPHAWARDSRRLVPGGRAPAWLICPCGCPTSPEL